MRGQLGIGAVDLRVIQVWLVHPGLEVVRHQPGRDAAEELKRRDVASVQARWSILSTGRTNMCREHASTITNAQTVRSFPVTGSSHLPSCP